MKRPLIILCIGYPSTGKSTTTQRLQFELSRTRNVDLLTTMSVRQSLGLLSDFYDEKDRDRVYDAIVRLADERLMRGVDVLILDGNFNKRKRRETIYSLAHRYRAHLIAIECRVKNLGEIERRMTDRRDQPEPIANRASSLDLYHLIKEMADPVEHDLSPDGKSLPVIFFDTETQQISMRNIPKEEEAVLGEIRSCLLGRPSCADLSQTKAFIFDIGGVLQGLRWEIVSNMLRDIKPNLSMDVFRNALYREKEEYFGLYEVSKMSPNEFWRVMARRLDFPPESIFRIQEAFKELYGPVDNNLEKLIASLQRSYRLFILSNSCPELEEAVKRNESFYRRFEKIYFSHRIGYKKPDPTCFRILLEENGLQADQCFYIDDVAQNVRAAEKVGMHGIVFLSLSRLVNLLTPQLREIS